MLRKIIGTLTLNNSEFIYTLILAMIAMILYKLSGLILGKPWQSWVLYSTLFGASC